MTIRTHLSKRLQRIIVWPAPSQFADREHEFEAIPDQDGVALKRCVTWGSLEVR